MKETLDFRLGFIDFARVHFISALHGSGVGNLFESVREAYDSSTRRVGTSMLTRIMTMAVEDHQPPAGTRSSCEAEYAHAGGYNPPIVVIHGNQVKDLLIPTSTLDELLPQIAGRNGIADSYSVQRRGKPVCEQA